MSVTATTGQDEIVSEDRLRTFARAVHEAVGLPADDAADIAEVLVWAELRGIWPQGLTRLPQHVGRIRAGGTKARPEMRAVNEAAGAVALDADNAFGHLAATRAMRLAGAKARELGVGLVSVRNVNHAGPLGAHVMPAIGEGLIGMVINNSPALIAPWGGTSKLFGNQAFAIGCPSGRHHPIVFDTALSAISWARIHQLQARGERLPENVARDPDGNLTQDPVAAMAGQLLPMSGAKGYGLALMWEVLTGVLAGGTRFAPEVTFPDRLGDPMGVSLFVLAIDPRVSMPHEDFLARVDRLIDDVHASPPAPGVERVYVPGERGFEVAAVNRRSGVTIPVERAAPLRALASELGIPW